MAVDNVDDTVAGLDVVGSDASVCFVEVGLALFASDVEEVMTGLTSKVWES